MTIALQAEREAIRRYSELAMKMRDAENNSAAALFERLILEEKEHERLLLEWMEQEGIMANPDIQPVKWRDPQISTTYNKEARDPYQSSPYRALAFAVHNEEIAFRYYSQVAAESDNDAVRKYAEVLAHEELGHAALLRAERRRAYHAGNKPNKVELKLNPRMINHVSDLLTIAVHVDQYLLDSMNNIAKDKPNLEPLISDTEHQVKSNKENLSANPTASNETISILKQLKTNGALLDSNANLPDSKIKRIRICCDLSFTFYDAIVESTTDEKIMLTAQNLAASALNRIGIFKQAFEDKFTSDY